MAEATDLQKQRAIEAAQGYLMLDLPDAALRQLGLFSTSEAPAEVEQLRGEAFRLKEDYERALQHFELVSANGEPSLDLWMGMAWCYKRVGRIEKAIECMRAAYQTSPKVAVVLYNLACYYSLAGEKEEALSWLARAFRMDNSYRKSVASETDFDPIRNDQEFIYLMQLSEPKESRKTT